MAAKQVIVMRTDLGMRKGKMIAQGAHASMAWLAKRVVEHRDNQHSSSVSLFRVEEEWIYGAFTKICVRVDSEEELIAIYDNALEAGLTSHLITDNGLTEFNGIPTKTCCAIGPNSAQDIDQITGHLKLL